MVVCSENSIEALFARNHAMCDFSDYCLALYPDDSWPSAKGGTAECLRYAVDNHPDVLRLGYSIDNAGLHMGDMVSAGWLFYGRYEDGRKIFSGWKEYRVSVRVY